MNLLWGRPVACAGPIGPAWDFTRRPRPANAPAAGHGPAPLRELLRTQHRYRLTSSFNCWPIASAINAANVWPDPGTTNAFRAGSQSNLKLFMCAETQTCRTGAFGLTTNLAGGDSNSIASAPELKSASKSCCSAALESRL